MKLPMFPLRKKKKLRASIARRSLPAPDEMDFEEMSEPNMKLSRALLIVLVLHVVAVAGIIAFNTIKSHQGTYPPASTSKSPTKTEPVASPTTTVVAATAQTSAARTPGAPDSAVPKAQPINNSDSGNFYTVAKGDNPVKIAKKLKVSESDLLAVNHIDDPRKLQIGQKLIVPAKKATPKAKKSSD
jgi:LysM repeat protein